MSDSDKIDDLYEIFKGGMDLFEEHEDKISRFMGNQGAIGLRDQDPLKNLEKREDVVIITVETNGNFDSVSIGKEEDRVIVGMDDKEVVAQVPDDASLSGADASLNNGVLEVTIPRGDD